MTALPTHTEQKWGQTLQGYPITVGRYEILRPLAEGGFGQVFLARMEGAAGFHRTVAIKRIRREHTSSADFVRDFIKEARIGGLLQHHHVVQVLGFEEFEGNYLLVMEYVDGVGLDAVISMARSSHLTLPLGVVAEACAQAAEGLQYIHNLNSPTGEHLELVHRDIKPSNLLLSRSGLVKITDFGIVRAANEQGKQTQAGIIKGTLLYLSPEQARGEPLDYRSDLYSLGAILYELLTLTNLWQEDQPWVLIGKLGNNDIAPRMARLPEEASSFRPVLERLLTAQPADRYPSASELAEDLRRLQQDLARPGVTLARLAGVWADEHAIRRGNYDVTAAPTRPADTDPFFPSPTTVQANSGTPTQSDKDLGATRRMVALEDLSVPTLASSVAEATSVQERTQLGQSDSRAAALLARQEPEPTIVGPLPPQKNPMKAQQTWQLAVLGVLLLSAAALVLWPRQEVVIEADDPSPPQTDASASVGKTGQPPATVDTSPASMATAALSPVPVAPPTVVPDAVVANTSPSGSGQARTGTPQTSASSLQVGRPPTTRPGSVRPGQPTQPVVQPETQPGGVQKVSAPTPAAPAPTPVAPAPTPKPRPVVQDRLPDPPVPPGRLTVSSSPISQVFLDGESIGETPVRNRSLKSGEYKLRLSRPDLNFQQSVGVTVRSGQDALVICKDTGCDVTYR